ncbi:MAG TPA: hypothetical protein VGO52_01175 [Hyphomonadaceae bacterium]|nr:hypothetical protein [Hyphomonadaceae bacterium]
MPVYYAVGSALLDDAEYADFEQVVFRKGLQKSITFSTGVLEAEAKSTFLTDSGPVDFVDIQFGKPLTVEIRYVYPGRFPKPGLFDKSKDLLVTSAMKSIASFNKAPRAVNFLVKDVVAREGHGMVAATDDGTPLVFYSPAVDMYNSVLTLEFGFRDFDPAVFKFLSDALKSAAGVPIFATSSFQLTFASSVVTLAGDVGKAIFEKPPTFKASEPIQFLRPGSSVSRAGFRLVTQTEADYAVLKAYEVHESGKLIDKNGAAYQGDIPYMVISMDGRANDSYKDFTPTAASAALLEDYFAIREQGVAELGALKRALELYNDYRQHKRVEELDEAEKAITDKTSDAYKENRKQRDAAAANIVTKELKVP